MSNSVNYIEPAMLRKLLLSDIEHAVLDAREEGEFGASHLFWAVPCPLSRMEMRVPRLLPSKLPAVVCVDDGGGLAERLAAYLIGLGYQNVMVLRGGIQAWRDAGFVLFSGVNVPSKAFGEWVEHHFGTESVDASELDEWIKAKRNMVVLDSRPLHEFERMSIPTGINVPGGELVYRVGDLAPDPETVVVVNCAGRTRSILGAESLRRAEIPNRVVALRNGTMGWELAGFTTSRGRTERYMPGEPKSAETAKERAGRFAQRSGVGLITAERFTELRNDASKTVYLLDVRDPAEFALARHPDALSAPGGQLVQETDNWIAVRNSQIVLTDTDGVRSRMTASWLRQMGHRNVFIMLDVPLLAGAVEDASPHVDAVEEITPTELSTLPDRVVLDLTRSIEFRESRIPGAVWGVRTRLGKMPQLATAREVIITSPDGVLGRLAVKEVRGLTNARVRVLSGGNAAWKAVGLPMEANRFDPDDDDCVDCYLRPFDRNHRVTEAMHEYLLWEVDLIKEIERDGTVHFGVTHA